MSRCDCGNEFDTPFCPQCGRQAKDDLALAEAYLRTQARRHSGRASSLRTLMAKGRFGNQEVIDSWQAKADHWNRVADAVAKSRAPHG